jgi:predicted nucleic acid-binding protein
LALSEALALVPRLTDEQVLQDDVEDAVRLLWDRIHIVPVDQLCLDRAAMIAREQPVHINDAIHLAAADRLPRPLQFITFDPAQIPVALSMGYDVISS